MSKENVCESCGEPANFNSWCGSEQCADFADCTCVISQQHENELVDKIMTLLVTHCQTAVRLGDVKAEECKPFIVNTLLRLTGIASGLSKKTFSKKRLNRGEMAPIWEPGFGLEDD